MPITARYTADASVACQENTVADDSEAQRMRLRLGSVFEELVALRQAPIVVAEALDLRHDFKRRRRTREVVRDLVEL